MRLINALIAHVRNDYVQAQSLLGYVKRRLLEKGTWAALAGAIIAADKLQPVYAGASIVIALIVALLPTP